MDLEAIAQRIRESAAARDWERFHGPKNLAMALSAEAELVEIVQWLTEEQSRALGTSSDDMKRVREELAGVQIYLPRVADALGVDLEQAVNDQIALNKSKYPVEQARGNAVKYNRRAGVAMS